MKTQRRKRVPLAMLFTASLALAANAAGTNFTYQGSLSQNGALPNQIFDMEFSLWDDSVGGSQVGPLLIQAVDVVDGLFATNLDFGAVAHADNGQRWLEITVEGVTLTPRQQLMAAPFAVNTRGINVSSDGNVGIGVSNPGHKLDVLNPDSDPFSALTASFRSASTIGTWLNLSNASPGGRFWRMISTGSANGEGAGKLLFGHGTNSGNGVITMTLQNNNKVGIGTVSPGSVITNSKLDVVGGHIAVGNNFGVLSMNSDGTGIGAGFDTTSDDALDFYSNGTRRLTIGANGNVGINTTNTSAPLTFRNVDERKIAFWQSAAPNGFYGMGMAVGGRVQAFTGMIGSFEIGHDDGDGGFIERMRVTSNGRVGIGTASPSQALHVIGNIQASGSVLSSCGILVCSDERYKKDIEPVANALDLVEQMRPVRYDWRRDEFPDRGFTDERQLGFIAQEVGKIAPEIVKQDNTGYYAVDYSRLTPILVAALQEMEAEKDTQIEELRTANRDLQTRLEKLEAAFGSNN